MAVFVKDLEENIFLGVTFFDFFRRCDATCCSHDKSLLNQKSSGLCLFDLEFISIIEGSKNDEFADAIEGVLFGLLELRNLLIVLEGMFNRA
jgi:hypothetical protein